MQSKTLTPERREQLNIVYLMLKNGTTKEEISQKLGITERTARDFISTVARKYPVVSLSDRKGYLLLKPQKDLSPDEKMKYQTLCDHAINENSKRASEISKRNEPLMKWLKGTV